MLRAMLALLLATLTGAQTVCPPIAVSPPFSTSVYSTVQATLGYAIVAAPARAPWSLSAVEWVSGVRVAIAPGLLADYVTVAPNAVGFALIANGTVYAAPSALATPLQLSSATALFAHTDTGIVYSADSQWMAFVDQSFRPASVAPGLYVVHVSGAPPPVRVSHAAHTTIDSFVFAPDGSQIAYTARAPNQPTTRRLFCVSRSGGPVVELSVAPVLTQNTTAAGVLDTQFIWTPDARRLVYVSAPDSAARRVFSVPSTGPAAASIEVGILFNFKT